MLKKSLLRSAPALRFPCFAWVPARALLARAFTGTTVHWTVLFIRLTLLRWQVRGSPSVANPLSGIIHALHSPCFAMAPAQAVRGLGVRRVEGPPDLHLLPPHPLELYLIPLRPWPFSARKAKNAVFALLHFSNTYVFEKCAVPPCTALRLLKIVFQQPASRASRWPCTPLAVTPVCACVSVTTPLYWGSTEPQPQGLVVGACGHTQRLGEFRGCLNGLY